VARNVWDDVVDIASKYNQPGTFTALNGYEWSTISTGREGSGPQGANLHRCVIFRDGPDRVKQILPFSAFDSGDPEKLWEFLASYEKNTGGRVMAIPHNGNISNGQMYAELIKGQAMTRDYAERRARWEPLMEATQEKGDGETHPVLSPEDEFADFETWDFGDSMGNPKEDWMLEYEYARSTLLNGIRLEEKLGVNPYKYGMVGSTDSHGSMTTTREENYFGKLPNEEPSAKRTSLPFLTDKKTGDVIVSTWQLGASGLAAIWAKENTREAIFDALARKEVYATTGNRMTVRVFAGWDFQPEEVLRPDFASTGYSRGVPMGGDLENAPAGAAPTFMIRSLRDPDGANLDRVQIIKGWLDKDGKTHERIYDVAVSDGRMILPHGRCTTPVGTTVDIDDASYTNYQLDRGRHADGPLEGPQIRSEAARLLLRARHRDPHPAMDGLRREAFRDHDVRGSHDDDSGAGLHLADLVHAVNRKFLGWIRECRAPFRVIVNLRIRCEGRRSPWLSQR
jgi:hypothetical protein